MSSHDNDIRSASSSSLNTASLHHRPPRINLSPSLSPKPSPHLKHASDPSTIPKGKCGVRTEMSIAMAGSPSLDAKDVSLNLAPQPLDSGLLQQPGSPACTEWHTDRDIIDGFGQCLIPQDDLGPNRGKQCIKYLKKRVPCVQWLPEYKLKWLRGDLLGALMVGSMVIPQGMAYALLAGLPPVYGLYSVYVAPIIYTIFGTSAELSVGPVAMVSLIVAQALDPIEDTDERVRIARFVAMLCGLIQVIFGLLKVGFIIENILSRPIISGFTTGAAVLIILSQFQYVFKLKFTGDKLILNMGMQLFKKIPDAHWWTVLFCAVCIAILLISRKYARKLPTALILLVVCTFISWAADFEGLGFDVVGAVEGGFPIPSMNAVPETGGIAEFMNIALVVTIVGVSESISVAKKFAAQRGAKIKVSQEFMALGLANFAGSFFQCYPVTGSLSRTAINGSMGVKTPLTSAVVSVVVILCVTLCTPLLYFIPKGLLAAIVITAALNLVDHEEPRNLWGVHHIDLVQLLSAILITIFFGAVYGILLSMGLSLGVIIFRTARPPIPRLGQLLDTHEYRDCKRWHQAITYQNVLVVRVDCRIYFANVNWVRERLQRYIATSYPPVKILIIEASGVNAVDSTGAHMIKELYEECDRRGIRLWWSMIKAPVRTVLVDTGLKERLGEDSFFLNTHEAVSSALVALGHKAPSASTIIHDAFPTTPTEDPTHADVPVIYNAESSEDEGAGAAYGRKLM